MLGRDWFCAKLIHNSRYRCIHRGYEPGKPERGRDEFNH
jgi:hypothetical protein